ncbi:MAG: sulfatase [Bryobacteraceae bacterium]|nr:sulfatase [Bryobacteraceae bacterium]
MTRRTFLATSALLAAQPRRLPNIVFILIDDLGWTDTGFNGSTYYETPNLDRLAKSSMNFVNGYAAHPVCSPTRAAIMTGKYPARLRLTSHLQGAHRLPYSKVIPPPVRLQLPREERTIAEALRDKGYRTACIGKWHLGGEGYLPTDQGFDVVQGGDTAGSTSSFFYPQWKSKIPLEGAAGDYLTDRLTTVATDFIRDSGQQPFFLYLAHFAVHTPIEGKPDLVTKYAAKSDPTNPQNYPDYAAMIQSVDESVGRVMAALDEAKLTDDTIVIFTSDNGGVTSREWKNRPVTSNLPLRSGKGHCYEGGIRVPLLIRYPGVTKPGSKCLTPISSIDYAPTLAEAAGAQMSVMDGRSLMPLLRGGELDREELYWYYPHYSPQLGRPAAAMRQGEWKLILFFEDSNVELYNLDEDPGERRELAARQAIRANDMREKLERWLYSVRAQLPQDNPNYDPKRAMEAGPPMGPLPVK